VTAGSPTRDDPWQVPDEFEALRRRLHNDDARFADEAAREGRDTESWIAPASRGELKRLLARLAEAEAALREIETLAVTFRAEADMAPTNITGRMEAVVLRTCSQRIVSTLLPGSAARTETQEAGVPDGDA
jgi:hypothetical protein